MNNKTNGTQGSKKDKNPITIKGFNELVKDTMMEVDRFIIDGEKVITGENADDKVIHTLRNPETSEVFTVIIPDNTGFVFMTDYENREVSGHVNRALKGDIDFDTLIRLMDEILIDGNELSVQGVRNVINTDYSLRIEETNMDSYKLHKALIENLMIVVGVVVNIQPYL